MNTYFVILCGGNGTRLWPFTRKNRPKHLLPFINKKSLLEQTINRINPIAKNKNIGIVTTQEQKLLLPEHIKEKLSFIIEEPIGRNTAPAILYSCLTIKEKDPDATIIFLPADHFIPEEKKFQNYLQKAINSANTYNTIITLGLIPTHPATGYGYIQANTQETIQAGKTYNINKFHEKPNLINAQKYIRLNNMFWNLGMFIGKVSTFLEEYQSYANNIYIATKFFLKTNSGYEKINAISFDYAIMEKSKRTHIIPCDFEWNDIGNLETFLFIQQKHKKLPSNKIISIDSKNNIIQTNKKIVSLINVENLCIVEDENIIVIANRKNIEQIKQMREKLKKENQKEFI